MPTNTSSRSTSLFIACSSSLVLFSSTAFAHPGHEASTSMLMSGLLHPLTGYDHFFAMLAVGLWCALTQKTVRRAMWAPICFLGLLLIGALAGMSGLGLPALEPIIMVSLLVLGLLVATRVSMPTWAGAAIVGFFALFHGVAHGSELPLGGSAAAFIGGFMLTTFALHLSGLAAGFALKHRDIWLTRFAGAGIALYGAGLLSSMA